MRRVIRARAITAIGAERGLQGHWYPVFRLADFPAPCATTQDYCDQPLPMAEHYARWPALPESVGLAEAVSVLDGLLLEVEKPKQRRLALQAKMRALVQAEVAAERARDALVLHPSLIEPDPRPLRRRYGYGPHDWRDEAVPAEYVASHRQVGACGGTMPRLRADEDEYDPFWAERAPGRWDARHRQGH